MNNHAEQIDVNASFVVAQHLSKSFGKQAVLSDLSFEIAPGDVIGILGKNGAGKTTLLDVMLGFSPANAGSAQLFGHDCMSMPGHIKARIGYVPQQEELIGILKVQDQLDLMASFYKHWNKSLIQRLCNDWELDTSKPIRTLSVGQRQKVSILLALGHEPDLLVLDEPVASLDPIARRQFLEQLVELSASGERAAVFSTHIVSDIERLANKIWILKDGRLYWQGELDELKESVVRVHIRSNVTVSQLLNLPNVISARSTADRHVVILRHWQDSNREALAEATKGQVEIERLSLEDILLELHQ